MKVGGFELEVVGEPRRGSFARVHEVKTKKGERLALKILEGEGKDEVYRGYLADEPLLTSLGEEEGFVPILARGVLRGQPWFLMPFFDESLRERLARRPFAHEETYQLGGKLAVAISLAHHRRIVHRDLKPENIFLTKAGKPLVADLGIARHVVALRSRAHRAKGAKRLDPVSPYMAPEEVLLEDEKLTPQADIYSLGAILHECVTDEPPHAGRSLDARLEDKTDHNFLPLMQKNGSVPFHLAKTITVSLMCDHRRRYKDGAYLAQSLGILTESRRLFLEQRKIHRVFAR
ncbi:MAG TPA: protein kinase [Planctomycetota bacterium]|nr:protein kinase [Planctomycetota bacterium]